MKLQIKLVRHGKTPGNEQGRYIGQRTDESLSILGQEYISENRERIIGEWNTKEILFFTSPMKRCIETLKLIAPKALYDEIPDLKEIDFGVFENKNYEELNGREDYQSWIDSGGKSDYPGGETLESFLSRNKIGFEKLVHKLEERGCDKAIVVCHGGSIMAILSQLTGEEYFDFQVKNGEGYLLELEVYNGHIFGVSYNRL